MPTVVELKEQARKLGLKGYSTLKKPALEMIIQDEIKRQENIKLKKIREAAAPESEKIKVDALIPTQPLEIDLVEVDDSLIQAVKGKGISNAVRIGNYLRQDTGRKKLSPAMARRARKRYNRGDFTVSLPALFPRVNVLPYL